MARNRKLRILSAENPSRFHVECEGSCSDLQHKKFKKTACNQWRHSNCKVAKCSRPKQHKNLLSFVLECCQGPPGEQGGWWEEKNSSFSFSTGLQMRIVIWVPKIGQPPKMMFSAKLL